MTRYVKNAIALLVLLAIGAGAVRSYEPPKPPIEGTTPPEIAASIAQRVQDDFSEYVIVQSEVRQPNEGSNLSEVQYVVVLNVDPAVLNSEPQTQQELTRLQAVYTGLQGSWAELLQLSSQHLMAKHPTVVQLQLKVFILDSSLLEGTVSADQLKAVPPDADRTAWLSLLALSPTVPIPQAIWDQLLQLPEVQRTLGGGQ